MNDPYFLSEIHEIGMVASGLVFLEQFILESQLISVRWRENEIIIMHIADFQLK
jgi:hypothetical protein